MDWVPAHFPKDAWALARFDGTPLYEYSDPRLRERESWGTLVFDFAKKEVQSFLISSAWFWIRDCHVDGLRVDAVSSMLYLTYDRPHDDLVRERGGRINQDAVAFLRKLNGLMAEEEPQVLMIAEEATSYEGVSHPVEEGGLGFTHKWNMGWMNDILAYMQTDYLWRGDHYHQLTFSLTYAFSENFILPISHDEVVHGKRSLLDKMPGDIWRKFASLRSFLMYQMAHPGAKLNFMGYELGMFIEWRFREELEWFLLDYESHRQLHHFVSVLNHLYLSESCLSEALPAWEGFIWNQVQDSDNSVIAFTRVDRQGRKVLCIFNLTPVPLEHYRLSVLDYGRYRMILNSDDRAFYGSAYLGDATEGRSYLTQPATLQAKEEQMRALEAEDRAFAQLLNQRREQLLGEAKAYAEAVQERVSDGRVSREDGERLTAAIRRLTDLPAPAVRAPEIRCHLELTLPPLAALYLLYEGVPDSGSADDGKRAPVRRRAARRTAEKP